MVDDTMSIDYTLESCPRYCYKPLPSADSIRLLTLYKHSGSGQVSASIATYPLAECPPFEALSYAWGDPTERHVLLLRDPDTNLKGDRIELLGICQIGIARNLFSALQHISGEQCSTWWIDALCINQQDNEKKSTQVGMMSEIYSHAETVTVWLGDEDKSSSIAFPWMMERFTKFMSSYHAPAGDQKYVFSTKMEQLEAFVATFSARGNRKWWERRWVIQEVACAQKIQIQCGMQSIDWAIFGSISALIRGTVCRDLRFERDNPALCRALKEIFRTLSTWWKPSLDDEIQSELDESLRGFLARYRSFKFSNPYDVIYAIYSLFRDKGYDIAPNYNRPLLDVYIDATEAMVRDTNNLDVLCFLIIPLPTGSDDTKYAHIDQYPSWLPVEDISNIRCEPRWLLGFSIGDPLQLFTASGDRRPNAGFLANNRRCLKLEGFTFDIVEYFLPKTIVSEEEFVFPDEVLESSSLRTLCCDCVWTPDGEVVRRLESSQYDRYEHIIGQLISKPISPESDTVSYPVNQEGDNEATGLWVLSNAITWLQKTARLCMTATGKLAWVTADAIEGDQLAIIIGSRVPLILRQAHSQDVNHFSFVGAAYVLGIMDGELMEEPDMAENITTIMVE